MATQFENPDPSALVEELRALQNAGSLLFHACLQGNIQEVRDLVEAGAPLWYQEPNSGWTCLHVAAESNDFATIKLLLDSGTPWSAVDACGFTAGDVALSLNNNDAYRLIKDSAVRSEFLVRTIQHKGFGLNENNIIVTSDNETVLASTDLFLKSKLRYVKDQHGQDICMARTEEGTEVGVMMGWERPIMEATIGKLADHFPLKEGLRVLNVGFGLGIIDTLLQTHLRPVAHYIIEPHPDVLAYMRETGWYEKQGVHILEGRWQDFVSEEEGLEELLKDGEGFDVIYTDTFSEQFDDLLAFFERVPDLVRDEHSVFSFFNGLGATNATIYDVYTDLAELHIKDVGLSTSWSDVRIDFEENEDVWGKTIIYFGLPIYRLPICQMEI